MIIMNEIIKKKHVSFRLLWICLKAGVYRFVIIVCYCLMNEDTGRPMGEFGGNLCNILHECNPRL